MLLKELREQVVFYGNQMIKSQLTMNTGGNVSARDRKTGLIAIKPTSKHYELLTPEDITVIDIDGNIIEGEYKPSSEWRMHAAIYKKYPRVCGIVHCHSIYATAMAVADEEIPLINHELCMYCSQPVKVMPFGMPGTDQLGDSALGGMEVGNNVALLKNHGTVAMGATLWHAFDAACAVEQAANAYFIAKQMGKVNILPPEGQKKLRMYDPLMGEDTGEIVEIRAV